VPRTQGVGDDDYAASVLDRIAAMGGPAHEVAVVPDEVVRVGRQPDLDAPLTARTLDRPIDMAWRRTSYSGLTRAESSLPSTDVEGKDDESPAEESPAAPREAASVPSPMADLPAGATFGSLVHAVLEHADPQADDFAAELLERVTEQLHLWPVDATPEALAAGLVPLNESPLGALAGGRRLLDIALSDRLRELDFELGMAGGDVASALTPAATLRDLAPLLRAHLAPGDPLAPYADVLEAPGPLGDQVLKGYLSGSIDVVLRVRLDEGDRFVVVDYKTNHLGDTVEDYAPALLAEAMLHSHYPLQAMLYAVVLHRFLRWRLPGYDPERHLGGVLYLYVRGMAGAATPLVDGQPHGVFEWRPPAALIVAMSDLLDGGGR
jgi:exodeoxyribonuclease V beta subunit